jgi:hypothetical protein
MSQVCTRCRTHLADDQEATCPVCGKPLATIPTVHPVAHCDKAFSTSLRSDLPGIEGMTWEDLTAEIQNGGRLVVYQFCVSIIILTFLRPSKVHLIRSGESAVSRGIPYTLLSLCFGWWGFPFGFIYTPMAVVNNFSGGKDVTDAVIKWPVQKQKGRI